MAERTKIEWTAGLDDTPGATWNPITGCSVVSPGCTNCYAMRLAGTRMKHHWSRQGLTQESKAGPVWTGEVRFNADWLDQPLRWRRPRMIFVCAHGDLFHESVPDEWIDNVFTVMALAPQHTFQVLTKRAGRMRRYLSVSPEAMLSECPEARIGRAAMALARDRDENVDDPWWDAFFEWPLPNVWLGVSAEDQARADERIPDLLATPAAVQWISAEPLLGPLDLMKFGLGDRGPDWIVAGGESGPGARPFDLAWARNIVAQCRAAAVPCFVKQFGSRPIDSQDTAFGYPAHLSLRDRKGGDWSEWPEDLRVREFPHDVQ